MDQWLTIGVPALVSLVVVVVAQLVAPWVTTKRKDSKERLSTQIITEEKGRQAAFDELLKVVEVDEKRLEDLERREQQAEDAHAECRREVAHLEGRHVELTNRVFTIEQQMNRLWDELTAAREVKHRAITALASTEALLIPLKNALSDERKKELLGPLASVLETWMPRVENIQSLDSKMDPDPVRFPHHGGYDG